MLGTTLRETNDHNCTVPPTDGVRTVSATDPVVEAITRDPSLLGIWGYLRLANRPMTLSEISAAAMLDASNVQRKLDVLGAYALVDVMRATSRRQGITYRSRYSGLQVQCRPEGDHEVLRRLSEAMQRHAKELIPEEWLAPGTTEAQGWHSDFTGLFNLTPPEVEELRRRLNGVVEYTNMLGAKYAKRGSDPELCNYILNFRVEPLPVPALPLAPVRIVLEGKAAEVDAASQPPAGGRLSARERQTAVALARGLTIEEVAQELGLARSTVATMTKRLYRKLGVRRRAEMVTRLKELGL